MSEFEHDIHAKELGEGFLPIPSIESLQPREEIDFDISDIVYSPSWPVSGVGDLSVALLPVLSSIYRKIGENENIIPVEPVVIVEYNDPLLAEGVECTIGWGNTQFSSRGKIIDDAEDRIEFFDEWYTPEGIKAKEIVLGDIPTVLTMEVKLDRKRC